MMCAVNSVCLTFSLYLLTYLSFSLVIFFLLFISTNISLLKSRNNRMLTLGFTIVTIICMNFVRFFFFIFINTRCFFFLLFLAYITQFSHFDNEDTSLICALRLTTDKKRLFVFLLVIFFSAFRLHDNRHIFFVTV